MSEEQMQADIARLKDASGLIQVALVRLFEQDLKGGSHRERDKANREIAKVLLEASETLSETHIMNRLPF